MGKNTGYSMRVAEFNSSEQMGLVAASIVEEELAQNPELLLCAATGNSPLPLYRQLAHLAVKRKTLFKKLRLIPLDEWIGLTDSKDSCDVYLHEQLIDPLNLSKEQYLKFNVNEGDLNRECLRINKLLEREGPIDLCILGLGKNGHLGFNEPGMVLQARCHIATLAAQSRQHAMLTTSGAKPSQGITLGMEDILTSKRIILIVSGEGKEQAKQAMFCKKEDPQYPATFLWQHDNVDCLVAR